MAVIPTTVEDCDDLLYFLSQLADEPRTIHSLAVRVGVSDAVPKGMQGLAMELWQEVLKASLERGRYTKFLIHVVRLFPNQSQQISKLAPRSDPEQVDWQSIEDKAWLRDSPQADREVPPDETTSARSQQTPRVEDEPGRIRTACQGLARARTSDEMKVAASGLREEVLIILATLAPGENSQPPPLAAQTAHDADNIAERLGVLGMNVLTVVDRLLELTESRNTSEQPVAGSELFLPETIDDLMPTGMAIGDPASQQTMHLARNARSATWLHAQRFVSAIRHVAPIAQEG